MLMRIGATVLIATGVLTLHATQAQQGVKRTDLQQHDLSIPGREVVQVRVDIAPGVLAPDHSHPGEEIVYVVEGTLEYRLEGKPPVTLKAGEVLFIPAGTVHSARNVGSVNAAELATYIVEKGNPLVKPAK
jgi:quercetin dioxygenase-like cupin family protein